MYLLSLSVYVCMCLFLTNPVRRGLSREINRRVSRQISKIGENRTSASVRPDNRIRRHVSSRSRPQSSPRNGGRRSTGMVVDVRLIYSAPLKGTSWIFTSGDYRKQSPLRCIARARERYKIIILL